MNEEKARKKELKRIAKLEKKSLKQSKKEAKKAFRREEKIFIDEEKEEYRNSPEYLEKRRLNEAPKRSVLEEVGNAVTHGVGALIAIAGLVLMLLRSQTALEILASWVYGMSMFIMMLMSCLYHSFKHGLRVKRLWRRFDYCSIYLLIGGTFAPLQLIELAEHQNQFIWGLVWFIVMWALIVTGITFVSIFGPGRTKKINFPLYFIIGWSGLMFIPGWWNNNRELLWWILGGGLVYTFGMIPFVLKKKASHFIWHIFVVAGAITQFIGILMCVYMV